MSSAARISVVISLCSMAAAICVGPSAAHAQLLGVRLEDPVVTTWDLAVNYVAGAPGEDGTLTVQGTFDPWGSWASLQSSVVRRSASSADAAQTLAQRCPG